MLRLCGTDLPWKDLIFMCLDYRSLTESNTIIAHTSVYLLDLVHCHSSDNMMGYMSGGSILTRISW